MAACGSDEDDDNAASQSSPSSTATSSGAGNAGGSGGSGEGGAGASAGSGGAGAAGGSGGAGATGGGGAGPQGNIVPSIDGYDFFVNCMPAVPPDPINGSFTVTYDNQDVVDGQATITKALLEIDDGNETTDWDFDVQPPTSNVIPAGMSAQVTHQKIQGSGTGTIGPCSLCGGNWKLKLTWDVAGTEVTEISETTSVQCAF